MLSVRSILSYGTLRGLCKAQRLAILFFILMSCVTYVSSAHALGITLAWEANASSEGVAGYKIYYGTESQNYSNVIDVGNSTKRSVVNLKKGLLYYFAATAYNEYGVESDFSGEVVVSTCTYKITPKKKTFKATGGFGTVKVNTQTDCSWSAESTNGNVLTINDGHNGRGKGYVAYSVSPNPDPEARTADLTIAEIPFTVTQKGTGISN
jgi:hypothetical protein